MGMFYMNMELRRLWFGMNEYEKSIISTISNTSSAYHVSGLNKR